MTVEIDCPQENQPATVVVNGTGGTGYIAARGRATDDDKFRRATLLEVYAKIYAGTLSGTQVPTAHPYGAVMVPPPAIGSDHETWYFPRIDGATCLPGAGSGGDPQTLVVWAKFDGVNLEVRGIRHFVGVCGSEVSCNPPGSGSGAMFAGGGASSTQVAFALDLVPAAWRVEVAGLPRGKGAFHGRWVLHLRRPVATHCIWDNGGDGVAAPQVRLRCEAPLASEWRLSLHHAKAGAAEYTRPAAEWNPLAPNVLHLAPTNGNGPDGFPASLTVVPA